MKIKKESKKTIIILVVFLVIALGIGYVYTAKSYSLWPFLQSSSSPQKNEPTVEPKDRSEDTPAVNTPEDTADNSPEQPSKTGDTVVTPPIDTPSKSASYPIENAHYKIDQVTNSSYNVTLYPISGADYDSQLRQYKQEVLTYFKDRYGPNNNITIKWTPAAAENI